MQGVKNIALKMTWNPSCKPPPQLGAPLVGCCHSENRWDWEGCVPLHLPALSSLILWGLHLNLLPTGHGSFLPPSPSTVMVPNSPFPRLHFFSNNHVRVRQECYAGLEEAEQRRGRRRRKKLPVSLLLKAQWRDFPGGPVANTPLSQFRGHSFGPCLRN